MNYLKNMGLKSQELNLALVQNHLMSKYILSINFNP